MARYSDPTGSGLAEQTLAAGLAHLSGGSHQHVGRSVHQGQRAATSGSGSSARQPGRSPLGGSVIDRAIEFPRSFVFGSATAAHQVEGNNRANDWWAHELAPDTNVSEPSGVACDHYHRFADDFRLLKS